MARKIAICSQKGGVGKTTSSVNLSAALAIQGYKVLLIDNDSQANATTSCGFRQQDIRLSLYDILTKPEQKPEPVIRKCNIDSLWLIPASATLVSAEIELVKEMGRELILKEKMEDIENQYDFIIVDCTPGLSLLVLNTLFFCDEIVIPIQSQYLALEGLDRILHAVHSIQKRMRHSINVSGILCTMYDRRTKLSLYILYELFNLFGNGLLSTVTYINTKLAEAPLKGMNIFEYEPLGNASMNYQRLAKEIIERGDKNWPQKYRVSEELTSIADNKKFYSFLNDENQVFKATVEKLKPLIRQTMSMNYDDCPESEDNADSKETVKKEPGNLSSENALEEDILWS